MQSRPACPLGSWLAAAAAAAAFGLVQAPAHAHGQRQAVTLHYQERAPYSSTDAAGLVTGLVASPAAQALSAAGIPYRWRQTPSQRQLALIQSGSGLHCGIGWFRNDERAALGKFSRALYRDRPFAALARAGLALPGRVTAEDLLADRGMKLLVKEGYSYGAALDGLIVRLQTRTVSTSAEPTLMGQMLRSGRADWMLVAHEEGELIAGDGLRLLPLAGQADGLSRHLYCSADLPDAWLARIDAALAQRATPPPAR